MARKFYNKKAKDFWFPLESSHNLKKKEQERLHSRGSDA